MTEDEVLAMLDSADWFLTDDGEDLCVDCASAHSDYIVEAMTEGHRNGWYVDGTLSNTDEGLRCCVCNKEVRDAQ